MTLWDCRVDMHEQKRYMQIKVVKFFFWWGEREREGGREKERKRGDIKRERERVE
jgi:hypothetical protein